MHGATIASSGVPNKNIGDAFLCVWPMAAGYGGSALAAELGGGSVSYADRALGSAVAILRDIDASAPLPAYAKNARIASRLGSGWRVKLGFGLHVGWAIEGAIGSKHKVCPSYLSPHVNIAARLESATKLYGVPILMSEAFVEALLLGEHHACVRQIDCVRLKGSILPMGIFTYDDPDRVRASIDIPYTQYCARFADALDQYRQGDWAAAAELLRACGGVFPEDEPVRVLLAFMAQSDFVAPPQWDGVRSLMEKGGD